MVYLEWSIKIRILLPYIYTRAQVIGKLVDSIMNSPVPKKLEGCFTVTEV